MLRPLTRLCLLIVGLAGICGVSYGQTVDETAALPRLAAEDPNGFVLEVQRQLSAAGYYNGSLSGILDRATIAGINSLCRHAGTIDDCQEGPLSPRGSEAVALALQSLVPATPVTTEVVAADETAEVPEQKAEVQKEAVAVSKEKVADPRLGPELITNGNFDDDTSGWTVSADGEVSSGWVGGQLQMVRGPGGIVGAPIQEFTLVAGRSYELRVDVTGDAAAYLVENSDKQYQGLSPGSQVVTLTASDANSGLMLWPFDHNATTFVDAISLREILDKP